MSILKTLQQLPEELPLLLADLRDTVRKQGAVPTALAVCANTSFQANDWLHRRGYRRTAAAAYWAGDKFYRLGDALYRGAVES